jgi:hypothetical protein
MNIFYVIIIHYCLRRENAVFFVYGYFGRRKMSRKIHDLLRVIFVTSMVISVLTAWGFAKYSFGPTPLITPPGDSLPWGGVAADPVNPDMAWVLTATIPDILGVGLEPACGLWRTHDRGATWGMVNDSNLLREYSCWGIAICESNPDIVYVGTNQQGVFKSTDGGSSWIMKSDGIVHKEMSFPEDKWCVVAIAVDPVDPNSAYCSVANLNEIDLLTGSGDHPGLYRTTDGGNVWIASNEGLPPREDPFDDMSSKTAYAACIEIIPQSPNIVVLGMSEMEINQNLLTNKEAITHGRVFYSQKRGKGRWRELSAGLPECRQKSQFGDLVRISESMVDVSAAQGDEMIVYLSHSAVKSRASITNIEIKSTAQGVFKFDTDRWVHAVNGLPVVNDEWNENAINTTSVSIHPIDPDILITGVYYIGEMGEFTGGELYASTSAADRWQGNWYTGLGVSPNMGYTEAIPYGVCFNYDATAAYTLVEWADGDGPDEGIYRLPPLP